MKNTIVINDIGFLRSKAASLPRLPGVYIMENKHGEVIYVGKSRSLRDRVSQYFHGSHDIKTAKMASNVNNFRFIVCNTEMDALILENDLIKKYTPKYNILLKDSKSYPYIKVTDGEFPRIVMTRKRTSDGKYFGPYSGAGVIFEVISTLEKILGIPSCKHSFPKDIGKVRPCVYRQIGRCCGVCAGDVDAAEYGEIISCAVQILRGNTKEAKNSLEERMYKAASEERFEEAARCRDSITALSKLETRRKVTSLAPDSEYDVIAVASSEGSQCAAVFYIRDGIISDSEQFIFGADEITGYITRNEVDGSVVENGGEELEEENTESFEFPLSAFIVNLYMGREYIPKEILISFEMPESERELVGEYLSRRAGRRVTIKTPVRGELRHVCTMAENDARRHAESRRRRADANERVLGALAEALHLEVFPERIECYDISNLGDEHITAGMIVAADGVFKKSDYRYFRIKSTETADDYASMREAISRRLSELSGDDKSFSVMPDLILLDGGENHVSVVRQVVDAMGLEIPVFGMVKDSHHKTRTLVGDGREISIAKDMTLFQFIYKLQEEVHRYTVGRMTAAKLKALKTSELEKIKGIGPEKAKRLLMTLGTLDSIKNASVSELEKTEKVSRRDAENIYEYFHGSDARE
ncbi:MAG: excinuclease ABC subunit C [Ruminococcaceae bacterium]|nr:excinuclease ABC subunit C [Oscillospiraceae bacterium]